MKDKKPLLWLAAAVIVVGAAAAVLIGAGKRPLGLDDVVRLAQKGEALSWADFDGYDCVETGSGLYIRVYEIDARFSLWIGGGPVEESPLYIRLVSQADRDDYIDIRREDVAAFIRARQDGPAASGS